MNGDKRGESRRRLRFRSGKLASPDGAFLGDCLIYDRSAEGARLRTESSASIPNKVLLFEDETNSLTGATIAWRGSNELGLRFTAEVDPPAAREIARRLAGKYYAM